MSTESTRNGTLRTNGFPVPRPPGDDTHDRHGTHDGSDTDDAPAPGTRETVDRLIALRRRLERSDLRPGPVVDAAFGELVGLCTHPPRGCGADVLDRLGAHADALRAIAAAGEGHMERYWSARIAAAPDPYAELQRFPYLANYEDLVQLELAALDAACVPRPGRVVLLGSGPLPLTGLVLATRYGAEVLHVDRDADAVAAGSAMAAATCMDAGVRSLVADLEAPTLDDELVTELGHADVVLVGALVGADAAAKAEVVARLAAVVGSGAHLLVRSAHGLRTLLYPEIGPLDLPSCEVLVEVHPHTEVVNSVLVGRCR
ncbi:nicotianamine synthase family protein [Pseudonocardia phyllosphaerae]|uniref:nicotianamine synthase family protein n=1 Tax=Pseudonocardia phyllosphaerae TaxID=3390502 RepID=UPI003979B7F0